jgi:DNA-binding SARP family transcriptional activator
LRTRVKQRRPLEIRLLGTLEFRRASGDSVRLTSRKGRGLLAYLAARPGQDHSRDALAALLWGDMGDTRARANLRQELFVIQRALAEHVDALVLDGSHVMLDPAAVQTDLAAFERAATAATRDPAATAALYAGELLHGFTVNERPFGDWLRSERTRVRALALDALERWAASAAAADRHEEAIEAGRRALALDPVRESVYRALMRMHARRGERAEVARQYQACVEAFRSELATTPDPDTTALYHRLTGAAGAEPPTATNATAPAPRPSDDAPLVGRDAEMARAVAVRDRALAGAGRVLVVTGEAGIGKTRLVDELVAPVRARGARVIAGHCYPSDTGFALTAWIDALRAVVGEEALLASLGTPWRSELAVLVPELGVEAIPGPSAGPRRLFEAVGRLIDGLARAAPLVLVLEDVHWADDATVRLFAFVARRIAAQRVLMIVTARDEEPEYRALLDRMTTETARARLLHRESLGPLNEEDAHALARALRPASADTNDAALLETVWRTSEGNPLAVVEAARAVTDGAPGAPGTGADIPELVRALIRERLDRLPDLARRALDMAAVIGRSFELRLLEQATALGEEAALAQVHDLVHRRLLDDRAHGLGFSHERIREVAYEAILPSRRRAMHAAAADAITVVYDGRLDDRAHALAMHWREARAWEPAARLFRLAADVASRRGALREALGCYDEALAALERLPESRERDALGVDLRLGAGHVMIPLDAGERLARCVAEAETLCERLGDDRRLATMLALNARHALTWRDPPAVVAAAERAYAVAVRNGDPEQIGDSLYLLSLAAYFVGDVRDAVAIGRRMIAEGLDTTRPGAVFTALRQVLMRAVLARALAELGELDEAARAADEAVALAAGRRVPYTLIVALFGQGTVCLRRDDPQGAMRAFARAVELGAEAGYLQLDAPARAGAAIAMARLGAVAEAVAELERILAEIGRTRTRLWITLPATWLAEAYLLAGRAADAKAQAETALRLARERHERLIEGWALCLLGEIAAHPDTFRPAEGIAACREAIAIAEAGGLRPLAAHAHRALGVLQAKLSRV